jgi:hypothetical protein
MIILGLIMVVWSRLFGDRFSGGENPPNISRYPNYDPDSIVDRLVEKHGINQPTRKVSARYNGRRGH